MNALTAVQAGVRAIARCDALGVSPFSDREGQLFRPYLGAAHLAARDAVAGWMAEAGLRTRVDAIGNLIGRTHAPDGAPALLIGSHLDSVADAGRYDGPLGIMTAIECAAAFAGDELPFAIEVIAFGDEEGSRFPASMLCSRALTRTLARAEFEAFDCDGISVGTAMRAAGLDPDAVGSAVRGFGEILAYIEPHIEQGPVLEALGVPVGVVSAIAGQVRLRVRFVGRAGHAGTTPMRLRHDAIAAAAEAVGAVERICGNGGADLVGTVGRFMPSSGAFNVIAGETEIGIDIRAASDRDRDAAADAVRVALQAIATRRGVGITIKTMQTLSASPCDEALVGLLADAVAATGVVPHRLLSGAGHDAMNVAALAPIAMLFIRCAGGISHHPAESATAEDAAAAIAVLTRFVENLARTYHDRP